MFSRKSLKKQIFNIQRSKSYLKCYKENYFQSFEVSTNRLQRFSIEPLEQKKSFQSHITCVALMRHPLKFISGNPSKTTQNEMISIEGDLLQKKNQDTNF